jgi:hypothetical protein
LAISKFGPWKSLEDYYVKNLLISFSLGETAGFSLILKVPLLQLLDYDTEINNVKNGIRERYSDHNGEVIVDEATIGEPSGMIPVDHSGHDGCVDKTDEPKLESDRQVVSSIGFMILFD